MSCPNCGYCPHCGRGSQAAPYRSWEHGIPPHWYGNGTAPAISSAPGTVSKTLADYLAEVKGEK